jgi:hypothetical protein
VNDPPNLTAIAILTQSWWDTGDAICYFGAIDGEVSPMEAVVERIARLQRGYTTATGWKLVIDDFDQQELCSRHEAFSFQLKCRYVSLALRYAVEDMPSKTWLGCCSEAIDSIYRMDGAAHVNNKETVSRWHLAFRRMVSGIVSREFGFGLKVSHEDLQKVKEYRANKSYSDVLAAMETRRTATKQPL